MLTPPVLRSSAVLGPGDVAQDNRAPLALLASKTGPGSQFSPRRDGQLVVHGPLIRFGSLGNMTGLALCVQDTVVVGGGGGDAVVVVIVVVVVVVVVVG